MQKSAGILLYKIVNHHLQIFLVHPGGPFWKGKEAGAWTIPKGEFTEDEEPLTAARREFKEETGTEVDGNFFAITPAKQKSGKVVYCWAVEGDINADDIESNSFELEWPYKSGKWQSFPEVDKAAWFSVKEAKEKINPAQVAFIDQLVQILRLK